MLDNEQNEKDDINSSELVNVEQLELVSESKFVHHPQNLEASPKEIAENVIHVIRAIIKEVRDFIHSDEMADLAAITKNMGGPLADTISQIDRHKAEIERVANIVEYGAKRIDGRLEPKMSSDIVVNPDSKLEETVISEQFEESSNSVAVLGQSDNG